MAVTVTGLFSGYDTGAIMDAILAAAAVPRDQVQGNIDELQTTSGVITEMSGKLSAISTLITDLKNPDTLPAYTAALSNTSSFTAVADPGGAVPGTWTVNVTALAANDNQVSQGYDDKLSLGAVPQGTMSVTVAGVTSEVVIDGTNDSLTDFAAALNDIDGVTAFVLDTGASVGRYRLVIESDDTGVANALTLDTGGLVTGGTLPTFTQAQAASDAQLTVNGIAISSASNNVDAVPGLTLNLTQAGAGPVSVTVARDEAAILAKVTAFVDAYNDLVGFYGVNSNYDAENGISGALVGESGARRIMSTLSSKVSNSYVTGSALSSLAMVGFSTNQDGTISFDSEEFSAALDDNAEDVFSLFTSDTGPFATIQSQIDDVFVDAESGILSSRLGSIEATVAQFEERILVLDDHLIALEDRLALQFAKLEDTIAQLNGLTTMLDAMLNGSSTKSGASTSSS